MTESDQKAWKVAGDARKKAVEAAKTLEMAFEEIDDHGAQRASSKVSVAAQQLREAAQMLEGWERYV